MSDLGSDERFERLLDECCARVRRGEPLERCLADYPAAYREELSRLVPVATRVGVLARDPSPEFTARLEAELLSRVADERRAGQGLWARFGRVLGPSRVTRLAAVAVTAILVLGAGGASMDRASADSLPDSPLYGVKSAREQVQLAFARAPEAQVDVRARQIAQRGVELDLAIERGKQPRVVDGVIARVTESADRMAEQALAARMKGNPVPARRALATIRAAERRLDRIIPLAQPALRPSLQQLSDYFEATERRLVERLN